MIVLPVPAYFGSFQQDDLVQLVALKAREATKVGHLHHARSNVFGVSAFSNVGGDGLIATSE